MKSEKIDIKKEIIEWIQIIVAAAAIALFLNSFIIANSRVPSASMENTIMTGDRVIGSRLSYLFSEPERGDIIIFRYPLDEKVYYVKRLIGLPGETVDIVDGKVYINGSSEPLDEPYLKEEMEPEEPMHFEVPEDCYFFLGDNRNDSLDARYWEKLAMRSSNTDPEHDYTFVERKKLVAKVIFRYYPKIGFIE
jgi:signal peptidase I